MARFATMEAGIVCQEAGVLEHVPHCLHLHTINGLVGALLAAPQNSYTHTVRSASVEWVTDPLIQMNMRRVIPQSGKSKTL